MASILLTILISTYPWPIRPFGSAHQVSATLGDARENVADPRFHRGIDIPAGVRTKVYSIISDTAKWDGSSGINAYVRVGNYWYIHLDNRVKRDSLVLGILDTTNTSPDSIGKVLDYPDGDHLHFQIGPAGGPFQNPLSYNGGPVGYDDTLEPVISSITFWRQGSEGDTAQQLVGVLNGRVDIRAYCQDIQTSGGVNNTSGIYKSLYFITDTLGNILYNSDITIKFPQVQPPNDGPAVLLVYDRHNYRTASPFYYWITNRIVNNQVVDWYWNTKQKADSAGIPFPDSIDADSIENAKFKDGYYWTKVMAYDIRNNADTESVKVHVDNFNPRVKKTDPESLFAFVPTKKRKVWCIFSEQMDTLTLTNANIKIRSLKSDSFNYPIINITYIKDSLKLYLTVDSFRFQDTVQVRLLEGVKDLAGKSIQGSKQRIAYSWTFVVGVLQLTDNNLYDIYPDVYHGKITWTQAPMESDLGEIVLYDFYNSTLDTISPGGGIHTMPHIYQNKVAWTGYGWGYRNPVYYYNGTTTQQIAPANKGRYSMEIGEGGVVWRAYAQAGGWYDTIWVEYYNPDLNMVYVLDTFLDYLGRYRGRADLDGSEVIWDGEDPTVPGYGQREIYHHYHGITQNFSQDTVYDDATADISNGQVFWLKDRSWSYLWFYDGVNKRLITDGSDLHSPYLHNGSMAWTKGVNMPGWWFLHYFDGRNTFQIRRQRAGWNHYAFQSVNIHNNQVAFLRLVYEKPPTYAIGYYGASLYDKNQLKHLTVDTLDKGNSNRIEVHNGFVVYDAWDGYDYEIYLYLSDTLFTPPALVKNLRGEVIGGKPPVKKVKLAWKANTEPDLVGYKIYRSLIPYQYGTIPYATILAPETTFIDTLPLEGMNYYVATAYDNLNNESGFSNQASVFIDNIPPTAPTNLVASYDSINQKVSLIWQASPDTDLKLYKIYRSEVAGSYTVPIDSVLKPYTTYIDSTIYLGKTYYYVVSAVDTNKNESGFSNEDTVIVPIFIVSNLHLATAYNNGHKIVSNPVGDKIHFVYANNGGGVFPSRIYYCYSSDSGKSFTRSEFVGSPGMYPALALDTVGNPCASWVSGSYIYYTYWTSSWAPPDTTVLPVENLSPPSMVVDKKDTVHLVYVQYRFLPPSIGDLVYLKFERTNFIDAVSETLFTLKLGWNPSIGIDKNQNIHILWQGENSICYRKKDSLGIWQSIDTIYKTTTNERLFPVLGVYGLKILAVWQDRDALGNLDIYSRMKTDIGWGLVKKVATTPGESRFAVLAGANHCLWEDNSLGNWEISRSVYIDTLGSWTTPENISNTVTKSVFPHAAYSLVNQSRAKLYSLWTEGDTIPYTIKFKKLDITPQPIIFADLGQEIQSPYCLKRDGYWVFGDRPYETVDWGYETLKYVFTGLDSEKEYRLDLACYFENNPQLALKTERPQSDNTGDYSIRLQQDRKDETLEQIQGNNPKKTIGDKGIGRIIQVLVLDGMPLDTIFITPNNLARRTIWLPQSVYGDGEIVIEIKKIKAKRVVCSEFGLYEFPKEDKAEMAGGPMSKEEFISKTFQLDGIYPNPTSNLLRIYFSLSQKQEVVIRLYDVSGRLVQVERLQKPNVGENEFLLIPKGLSSGVYFLKLEIEGYNRFEKVVIVR